jgi:hypothetical protein
MARTLRNLIAALAFVVLMMAGFASPSDARCLVDEDPARCQVVVERPLAAGTAFVSPASGAQSGQSSTSIPGLGSIGGLGPFQFAILGLVLSSICALVLVGLARLRRPRGLQAGTGERAGDGAMGVSGQALLSMTSGPMSDDSHIPRWRRPSVAAARFETDNSNAVRAASAAAVPPPRPRLAFTESIDKRAERMLVRYDNVPLLEQPDEAFGRILEELQSGDEVEIIERDSLWAHVRAPTGVAGWTPVMTVTAMTDASFLFDLASTIVVEPEPPPEEESVPLEVLLEAIVAERRASQESDNDAHPESNSGDAPVAPAPGTAAMGQAAGKKPVAVKKGPAAGRKAAVSSRQPPARRPRGDGSSARQT